MADVQIRFRAQGSEAKREINQLTKEIQELRRGMEQTQRTSTARLQQQEVSKLAREQRELAISGDTSSTAYRNLNDDIIRANQVLEALRSEMRRYNAIVQIAEDNADKYALSTQLLAASQAAAAQAIRDAEGALQDGAISYGEYVTAASRVRENIEALAGGQAALNDFWRVASGQVEDYTESIQTTIPSLVNLTRSENALTAAIEANLQALQAATGDPLSDYIDSLTLTSRSADAAFGSIHRVGEAVRDADFRHAEAGLRDFDDAFSLSEATIPRVRSEIERFTGTLPDASRSIRDTTLELRNLSQEAQAAARDAEFLNSSFSALDAFDPQTPDRNAQSFDSVGFAARTGEELASQAIRTAGTLRRIEQERVENLADLEREYSEQIIAINEEKRQKLAAVEQQIEEERVRRLASIRQAFAEAADAEVAARERAAERIQQIEARAAEQRERLRERLNERLIALEERRDDRIQDLNDGFIEREQDRQQEILNITQRAAEARAAAEQRYADTVQEINNRLVEDVLSVQRQLAEDIESLEAGFVQRQADRADEIVRITEEAADARATANQTFVDTMQGIYNDLVTAWDALEEGFTERQADRAQQRIEIEQRAAQQRIAIEARAADARVAANRVYTDTVARISRDLVDEVRRIQAEIVEVEQEAAQARIGIEQESLDARTDANQDYAQAIAAIEQDRVSANQALSDRVGRISTALVDEVRRIQERITDIERDAAAERVAIAQESLDARTDAHEDYARSVEEIESRRDRRLQELQGRIAEIQQDATEARLRADQRYADRFQDIQNDLVDSVVDIQRDLNDTLNDLRDEQLRSEQDRLDSLVELHEDTQQRLEDLERDRNRTIEDLREEYQRDQLNAATQLDRDLEDTEGDPEKEAEARERFNRRIQDLTRDFHRDVLDLQRRQSRAREDLARRTAEREVQIAEAAQARQAEIEQRQTDARTQAHVGIAAAETAAGVSFEQAQANYVPALSAHEQALLTHAEALGAIAATERSETAERARVLQESFDATAESGETLAETLAEINRVEQERLTALESESTQTLARLRGDITAAETRTGLTFEQALENYTPAVDLNTQAIEQHAATLKRLATAEMEAGASLQEALTTLDTTLNDRLATLDTESIATVGSLRDQIRAAETRTGLTFEEALENYRPAVDLNTQALQALTEALRTAATQRGSALSQAATQHREALGALDAAGAADRASTTASQRDLETGAGVSIEEARANFVPALSSAAQATLTLNASIQVLDTSFKAAIAEIQQSGLVDRQAVDDAIGQAIAGALAQQTALETQAGTTFAAASAAFTPGLSDIDQAGADRDTALSGISANETAELDAVSAQSIADRLETDAAITETRDQYIKERDAEIFKHNAAILQLNLAEAADIKAVRATLTTNLTSIDKKLDVELAEIRETKVVFDTRMNELITAINADANESVATLNADTAAMRTSLEELAAEARDNAWKSALLKIASTGITVAGVAVGAAVGAPQAGLVVGQAVGGLVEQGGNELFHFERTDRIARSIARQETLRRSRSSPNYLPDANQIRNARDVSREIVAGVTEGLNIGSRRDGGLGDASQQASFPEELTAQVVIQFPDGSVQELADQVLRLREQDRTNL